MTGLPLEPREILVGLDLTGYRVETPSGRRIGRVLDSSDEFLLLDCGRLRRRHRALPVNLIFAVAPNRRSLVASPGRSIVIAAPRCDALEQIDAADLERHFAAWRLV